MIAVTKVPSDPRPARHDGAHDAVCQSPIIQEFSPDDWVMRAIGFSIDGIEVPRAHTAARSGEAFSSRRHLVDAMVNGHGSTGTVALR